MFKSSKTIAAIALSTLCTAAPVLAADMCASPEQSRKIQEFYAANPGTVPTIAARKLQLPEEVVVSGMGADNSVSAPGSAFADVWAAMTEWKEANFLIMKGNNVFEILSGVGEGSPSKKSQYFNVKYEHPLRGHLRPDLYTSIYAVIIPDEEDSHGVFFYDEQGDSVFAAFISGGGLEPSASELAKFDDVWALIKNAPSVCPTT